MDLTHIDTLRQAGAHFVLCHDDKRPVGQWKDVHPSKAAVAAHTGLVGIVPASVGLWVLDIDDREGEAVAAKVHDIFGTDPLATSATHTAGRLHLLYKAFSAEANGNQNWALMQNGIHRGETRAARGYAIIWDASAWCRAVERDADPVSPALLPKPNMDLGPGNLPHAGSGHGNDTLNKSLYQEKREGLLTEAKVEEYRAAALARGFSQQEVDATIASVEKAEIKAASKAQTLDINDLALALAQTDLNTQAAYIPSKDWFARVDGTHLWREDTGGYAVTRHLSHAIAEAKESGTIKRGFSPTLLQRDMRAHLLDTDPWDDDAYTAGLPDDTVIDLRTGQRVNTSAHRVTKRLGAVPDTGEPTRWLKFLHETVDAETVNWLQRWVGYTLTGSNVEQKFLFLLGSGSNGKSTFVRIIGHLMGEYYATVAGDALLGPMPQHRQWMARLDGKRMVSVGEAPDHAKWRLGDLKDLTGGDTIAANRMRKDSYDFVPVCKLYVCANTAPRITVVDNAIERRLVLLPFSNVPAVKDVDLGRKLLLELPQIVGWALQGAASYIRQGLGAMPASAQKETKEYLDSEDTFGLFLADEMVIDADAFTSNSELRVLTMAWCEQQGLQPWTVSKIKRELIRRPGFNSAKKKGERGVQGLRSRYQ